MATTQLNELKQCRFYKGEKECPDSLLNSGTRAPLFWAGERMFVYSVGTPAEKELIDRYLDAGLAGLDYDLPLGLLASIFAVYSHGADNPVEVCAAYFSELVYPDYTQLTVK